MGRNVRIAESAKIAATATICDGVFVGENAVVGEGAFLDIGCIVRANVEIGNHSKIGSYCILGEYLQDFYQDMEVHSHPLRIGDNALIRSQTIIYGDCIIGDHFQTGHKVTIREGTKIGENTRIGTLSDIQGRCEIGNYVNLHSNVHIGQKSKIHDYVWIFPYVVLTNDPQPPSEILLGVEISEFAVVATGSIVLPGVHIGKDAMVGAGSVVTKDVPDETVVFGNPAKSHGSVREIRDKNGEPVYPWREHFDRGMPWMGVGYDALESWVDRRSPPPACDDT